MALSVYADLTDKKLKKLLSQLTEKYGKDLHDDSKSFEERQLTKLAAEKASLDRQEEETTAVRESVKEWMIRKLKELALINYLSMEKRKDFGVFGEQRVSIGFCRNIMHIPNNREVSQFDMDRFHRILKECDIRNGNKSGDDYLEYIKNYSLEILGKAYPITDFVQVNKLLEQLGADYYFFNTYNHPYGVRYIFGKVEKRDIEQNKAYIILQEYIRSPQFILSIVSEIFNDSMMIRLVACEVIFFNKYQKFFDKPKAERNYDLRHINSSIREGIKACALSLYDAANTKDVLKIKAFFIQEMINEIFWHEIGHHISFTDMEPTHFAFHYNFPEGEGVGTVLIEALADWAPAGEHGKGVFTWFVELAQADVKRATRNFYVYISDKWFVDETEEFMSLMSNILPALAIYFINTDGSVDFIRLKKEKDRIYTFFLMRYKKLVDKLLEVIKKSNYKIDNYELDYVNLEEGYYRMYQRSRNAMPLKELRNFSFFWINVVDHLEKYSAAGWKEYQHVLKEEASLLEQMILKEIIKDDKGKYRNSLREYIIQRAKKIGIVKSLQKKKN